MSEEQSAHLPRLGYAPNTDFPALQFAHNAPKLSGGHSLLPRQRPALVHLTKSWGLASWKYSEQWRSGTGATFNRYHPGNAVGSWSVLLQDAPSGHSLQNASPPYAANVPLAQGRQKRSPLERYSCLW
eukprot:CAMPEP_0169139502 /NCGR_PEP_ID=MMETSP1015-20121227/43003_1 /TAXON_ID=342587 /ORGANISM="Karlodinium micrum, Strain CCMP2283" /LENGTH=127 /DNA_ID=CAMNT_0009205211 /DNA_START=425 /DNA_END=805 /DNA_ORIENTATION=-